MNTIKISLYVGTYHKYNSGSIAGKWVDLTDFTDLTEFYEYCAELHSDEDDPEYMFQDFEAPSLFDNMGLISEGYLSDDIFEAIDLLETADYDVEVYEAFANHFGGSNYDMQELLQNADENYTGVYSSDEYLAMEIYSDHADQMDSFFSNYIDWEKLARDLMISDYVEENGHYFRQF